MIAPVNLWLLPIVVPASAMLFLAACGTEPAGGRVSGPPPPPPQPTDPYGVESVPPVWPTQPPKRACPKSGALLTAEPPSAAMGLRVQSVTLTNCGRKTRQVHGYPGVRLLDKNGDPLKVDINRGARQVTTAVTDPGPKSLTVRPGRSVRFQLVWRNTYDDHSRPPQLATTAVVTVGNLDPENLAGTFDLGSTGRLGITAWEAKPA